MVSSRPFSPPQISSPPIHNVLPGSSGCSSIRDFILFFEKNVLIFPVHELAAAAGRPHRVAPEAPWAAPGL